MEYRHHRFILRSKTMTLREPNSARQPAVLLKRWETNHVSDTVISKVALNQDLVQEQSRLPENHPRRPPVKLRQHVLKDRHKRRRGRSATFWIGDCEYFLGVRIVSK